MDILKVHEKGWCEPFRFERNRVNEISTCL